FSVRTRPSSSRIREPHSVVPSALPGRRTARRPHGRGRGSFGTPVHRGVDQLPLSVRPRAGLMSKERPLNLPPIVSAPRTFRSYLPPYQSDRSIERPVPSVTPARSGSRAELFPMHERIAYQGITFDDVLLEPGYSDLLPHEADIRSQLTARIGLNIPILSSPMDTVTEAELAIALAQEGGLGVIHKNMSVEEQTREVDKVKRSENGIIVDPITLPPDATVGEARKIMRGHNISGVPLTVTGYLRGILTRRHLRFLESNELRIEEVMTKDNLVTAPADTSLEEADRILTKNKVEKLLLVDDEYRLKGLITIKDIDKLHRYPHACK